jgi:hypothetical protein
MKWVKVNRTDLIRYDDMNNNERPDWYFLVFQPYEDSPIRKPVPRKRIFDYKLNDLPPDDLLELMHMAVEYDDKEWFEQLSEQYNKTIIKANGNNT